jgi:hypothetical protein
MERKTNGLSIVFLIIAIIVGSALYKQFDFQTMKFAKPALSVVYLITFVASVVVLVRGLTRRSEK